MNEHTEQHPNDHDGDIVLEVEGVSKQFPGVLANDNINLQLRKGEILALLGENGAGKSTLMNIIYGLYRQTSGTIRLKGHEVNFSSPREAIHSGIGMVHQHFQLVPVMTVAENVVLGEESTAAYQGKPGTPMRRVIDGLPYIVLMVLALLIGYAITQWPDLFDATRDAFDNLDDLIDTSGTFPHLLIDIDFDRVGTMELWRQWRYFLGSIAVGLGLSALAAFPPAARIVWGAVWRVGLAFVAVSIAVQLKSITRVGITAVALRQEVDILDENRPRETDEGYTVKSASIQHMRIPFNWSKEYRDADTDIDTVIESAITQMEEYRDDGIPGWWIDAINDVPPLAGDVILVLLLFGIGAHAIGGWRGIKQLPGALTPLDLVLMGGIVLVYARAAQLNLDGVSDTGQLAFLAALFGGLAWVMWTTIQKRANQGDELFSVSPLDGVIDAFLMLLDNTTEVRNVRKAANRVHELSREYGLEVDPDAMIEKLPVGMQQRVEIIKALYRQADILILDEPTAVLTPQEAKELFKIMRQLAAQGVTIIFITHKLKEVFEVATKIAVMRGGRLVGTTTPQEATETSLAAMMVGREVILQVKKDEATPQDVVLEVDNLSAIDDRGAQALNGISFEVRAGEVLGIAGVQGNGQTELVEVLTGLRASTSGSVTLLGIDLQPDEQPDGGLWARLGALLFDLVIVSILAYFVGFMAWHFNDGHLSLPSAIVVFIVVHAMYFLGTWMGFNGSPGMSIFGLEISEADRDERPSGLRLLGRYVAFLVACVPLLGFDLIATYIMAVQHPKQRFWYDSLFGMREIRRERITPRRIKDAGTSHIPEDRLRHGMVKSYSVADNLVLNDFYERPFAQEPNLAQLPGTLLRYLIVVCVTAGVLYAIMRLMWDEWLWSELLDAYHVPENLREISEAVNSNQRAELQYPLIIGVLFRLIMATIFGIIAHFTANAVLGAQHVRDTFRLLGRYIQQRVWKATGHEGLAPEVRGGLLRNDAAIMAHARSLIEEFDIRTPGPEVDGGNLSGGNQQKLVVAREFSRKPKLLIAAQPTRGIDVGSIEFIHKRIIEQRDEGAAVLLVSAELDEIMALSDRIAVLYKGEVIDTLPASEATREGLGLLMAGIKNGEARGKADDVEDSGEASAGALSDPSPA